MSHHNQLKHALTVSASNDGILHDSGVHLAVVSSESDRLSKKDTARYKTFVDTSNPTRCGMVTAIGLLTQHPDKMSEVAILKCLSALGITLNDIAMSKHYGSSHLLHKFDDIEYKIDKIDERTKTDMSTMKETLDTDVGRTREELERHRSDYQQQLATKEAESRALQQQLVEKELHLRTQYDDLIIEQLDKSRALQQQLATKKDEFNTQQYTIQQLKSKESELTTQQTELHQQLATKQTEFDAQQSTLQQEIVRQKDALYNLQTQLVNERIEHSREQDTLSQQRAEQTAEVTTLSQQLEQKETELYTVKNKLAHVSADRANIQARLTNQQQQRGGGSDISEMHRYAMSTDATDKKLLQISLANYIPHLTTDNIINNRKLQVSASNTINARTHIFDKSTYTEFGNLAIAYILSMLYDTNNAYFEETNNAYFEETNHQIDLQIDEIKRKMHTINNTYEHTLSEQQINIQYKLEYINLIKLYTAEQSESRNESINQQIQIQIQHTTSEIRNINEKIETYNDTISEIERSNPELILLQNQVDYLNQLCVHPHDDIEKMINNLGIYSKNISELHNELRPVLLTYFKTNCYPTFDSVYNEHMETIIPMNISEYDYTNVVCAFLANLAMLVKLCCLYAVDNTLQIDINSKCSELEKLNITLVDKICENGVHGYYSPDNNLALLFILSNQSGRLLKYKRFDIDLDVSMHDIAHAFVAKYITECTNYSISLMQFCKDAINLCNNAINSTHDDKNTSIGIAIYATMLAGHVATMDHDAILVAISQPYTKYDVSAISIQKCINFGERDEYLTSCYKASICNMLKDICDDVVSTMNMLIDASIYDHDDSQILNNKCAYHYDKLMMCLEKLRFYGVGKILSTHNCNNAINVVNTVLSIISTVFVDNNNTLDATHKFTELYRIFNDAFKSHNIPYNVANQFNLYDYTLEMVHLIYGDIECFTIADITKNNLPFRYQPDTSVIHKFDESFNYVMPLNARVFLMQILCCYQEYRMSIVHMSRCSEPLLANMLTSKFMPRTHEQKTNSQNTQISDNQIQIAYDNCDPYYKMVVHNEKSMDVLCKYNDLKYNIFILKDALSDVTITQSHLYNELDRAIKYIIAYRVTDNIIIDYNIIKLHISNISQILPIYIELEHPEEDNVILRICTICDDITNSFDVCVIQICDVFNTFADLCQSIVNTDIELNTKSIRDYIVDEEPNSDELITVPAIYVRYIKTDNNPDKKIIANIISNYDGERDTDTTGQLEQIFIDNRVVCISNIDKAIETEHDTVSYMIYKSLPIYDDESPMINIQTANELINSVKSIDCDGIVKNKVINKIRLRTLITIDHTKPTQTLTLHDNDSTHKQYLKNRKNQLSNYKRIDDIPQITTIILIELFRTKINEFNEKMLQETHNTDATRELFEDILACLIDLTIVFNKHFVTSTIKTAFSVFIVYLTKGVSSTQLINTLDNKQESSTHIIDENALNIILEIMNTNVLHRSVYGIHITNLARTNIRNCIPDHNLIVNVDDVPCDIITYNVLDEIMQRASDNMFKYMNAYHNNYIGGTHICGQPYNMVQSEHYSHIYQYMSKINTNNDYIDSAMLTALFNKWCYNVTPYNIAVIEKCMQSWVDIMTSIHRDINTLMHEEELLNKLDDSKLSDQDTDHIQRLKQLIEQQKFEYTLAKQECDVFKYRYSNMHDLQKKHIELTQIRHRKLQNNDRLNMVLTRITKSHQDSPEDGAEYEQHMSTLQRELEQLRNNIAHIDNDINSHELNSYDRSLQQLRDTRCIYLYNSHMPIYDTRITPLTDHIQNKALSSEFSTRTDMLFVDQSALNGISDMIKNCNYRVQDTLPYPVIEYINIIIQTRLQKMQIVHNPDISGQLVGGNIAPARMYDQYSMRGYKLASHIYKGLLDQCNRSGKRLSDHTTHRFEKSLNVLKLLEDKYYSNLSNHQVDKCNAIANQITNTERVIKKYIIAISDKS
jgi:hypothetical protein